MICAKIGEAVTNIRKVGGRYRKDQPEDCVGVGVPSAASRAAM